MQELIEKVQDLIDRAKDALANRTARYILIAIVVVVLVLLMVGKSYAGTVMIFDQPKSKTTQYLALKSDECKNANVLKSIEYMMVKGMPPPPGILREADGKYEGEKAGACWTEYKTYILIFWEDLTYTFMHKSDFRGAI